MHRRRLQFGLRNILLAMTALAVPLALLAAQWRERARVANLESALRDSGGATYHQRHVPLWWTILGWDQPVGAKGSSDEDLALICQLPSIGKLDLSGTTLSAGALRQLEGLTELKELSLSGPGTTDEHLAALANLTNLETLRLAGAAVTDAGLLELAKLTKLRRLDLDGSSATIAGGLNLLLGSQQGRVADALDILGSYDGLGETEFAGDYLLTGNLAGPQATDSLLDQLPTASLQAIKLAQAATTPRFFERLGGLPELRWLAVDASAVDQRSVAAIGKLPSLQGLQLTHLPLAHFDLAPLTELQQLTWLDLSNTGIDDQALTHLGKLRHLELLRLRHTTVSDAGLAHLAKLTELRELDLGHTQVTDAGLVAIARLPKLQVVNLDACQVSDGGLALLADHATLELVQAEQTAVTEEARQRFRGDRAERLLWAPPEPSPALGASTLNARNEQVER